MNWIALKSRLQTFLLNKGIYVRPGASASLFDVLDRLKPVDPGCEFLRVGRGTDGTYTLPDVLTGIEYCFSPGVGPTMVFEEEIYDRLGIKSFCIDASIETPPTSRRDFFEFSSLFLSSVTQGSFVSLDDWLEMHSKVVGQADLVLQMDIEGAEYGALLSASPSTIDRFRVILIEIHGLDLLSMPICNVMFRQFLDKLLKNHTPVYANGNNCCGALKFGDIEVPRVLELTLLRNDFMKGSAPLSRAKFSPVANIAGTAPIEMLGWYSQNG